MNKQLRILISSIAIMAFVAACASHRYTVVEPPKASLTNYSVLEIPEFDSNLKSAEAMELAARVAGANDQAAFQQLVVRNQAAIRGFLRRLLSGDDAAADLRPAP